MDLRPVVVTERTTMQTITVTIGRNVGIMPMNDEQWAEFQRETRHLVASHTSEIVTEASYDGSWEGDREASIIFHAIDYDGADDELRDGLAFLANVYAQQSIGLAIGEGELVNALGPLVDRLINAQE